MVVLSLSRSISNTDSIGQGAIQAHTFECPAHGGVITGHRTLVITQIHVCWTYEDFANFSRGSKAFAMMDTLKTSGIGSLFYTQSQDNLCTIAMLLLTNVANGL